jgi:hypothetical protein
MLPEINTRGDMGTSTAYAGHPPTMVKKSLSSPNSLSLSNPSPPLPSQEVSYNAPRDSYLDPQYTATKLAPALDVLASHSAAAAAPSLKREAPPFSKEDQRPTKQEKVQDPQNPMPQPPPPPPNNIQTNTTTTTTTPVLNPFAIPSTVSLQTWEDARVALSNPAYFYTTMHRFGSINEVLQRREDGGKEEEPEERFPVRMREVILEVEQGIADLRMLLKECLRTEDAKALRALRERVQGALVFE